MAERIMGVSRNSEATGLTHGTDIIMGVGGQILIASYTLLPLGDSPLCSPSKTWQLSQLPIMDNGSCLLLTTHSHPSPHTPFSAEMCAVGSSQSAVPRPYSEFTTLE